MVEKRIGLAMFDVVGYWVSRSFVNPVCIMGHNDYKHRYDYIDVVPAIPGSMFQRLSSPSLHTTPFTGFRPSQEPRRCPFPGEFVMTVLQTDWLKAIFDWYHYSATMD
jgi:hypothetical protein